MQAISRGVGDCYIKVLALCDRFVHTGAPVKIHVGNGICNLFDFRGQTLDVSERAVLPLNIRVFMMMKEIKTM